MVVRALVVAGILVAVALLLRVWRRPPALGRLDLPALSIEGPVIVQFTTPWCGPCKAAAPQLRRTADAAGLAYAEVDVAARPEVARAYGIRRVPTIAVARSDGGVLGIWTALPENAEIGEAARDAGS